MSDVGLELDPGTRQLVGKTNVMPTDLMEQAAIAYPDSLSQTAQERCRVVSQTPCFATWEKEA